MTAIVDPVADVNCDAQLVQWAIAFFVVKAAVAGLALAPPCTLRQWMTRFTTNNTIKSVAVLRNTVDWNR